MGPGGGNMQQQMQEIIEALRGAVPALQAVKTEGRGTADEFKNLISGMASGGSSLQSMASSAALLVPGLGEMKMAFDVAKATVSEFTDTVKKYVSAYSPASVAIFDQAMKDLTAVIGYELQPAIEGMTQIVREISSSLFADGAKVRAAIQEATDAVVKAFRDNKATVDFLTTEFANLVIHTAKLVEHFAQLNHILGGGLIQLLAGEKKGRDAFGLAAGPGDVTDPTAAFLKSQRSALASGGAAAETPEDKRHKEIMDALKIFPPWAQKVHDFMGWFIKFSSGGLIDNEMLDSAGMRLGAALRKALVR